jgi:hypothetical protein
VRDLLTSNLAGFDNDELNRIIRNSTTLAEGLNQSGADRIED